MLRAVRGRPAPPPLKTLAGSLLVGTSMLTAASAVKIGTLDAEGIDDRVYRLHYNAGQRRTDRFAGIGAGVGAVLGAMAGAGSVGALTAAAGGAAAGAAVGVAAHVATARKDE